MRSYSNARPSEYIWPALAAAGGIGVIGALSVICRVPWLFASLGPTIVIQCGTPHERTARPWNVVVSHLLALAAAFLTIHLVGAVHLPPFAENSVLTMDRAVAAAVSVGLGFYLEVSLDARHPPSASTALLVSLGIVSPTWKTAATIAVGVLLVAAIGEVLRQLLGRSSEWAKG